MKCCCCDKFLNDSESTARHPDTNAFLDICFGCLKTIGITPVVREEFEPGEEINSEDWFEEQPNLDEDEDE